MDAQVATLVAARKPILVRPRRRLAAQAAPRLSVVVVNYHQWEDTAKLVRQLRAAPALRRGCAEIVVVDNHSPFDPVVSRLRRLSGVSLRRWRRNRGFARAVNEGCRVSRGDWLLLLNPDMTLEPDFLDEVLVRAGRLAEERPRAGILGFRLRNSDGSRQLSAGPFPTLWNTLARLALPRPRRKYSVLSDDGPRRVDWVTGCCLLVRRSCWEELGGLDRDFFLYYEDVDLCRRAREHNWEVWYDPALTAVHHNPLHGRAVPALLRLITRHALLTYAHKHWSSWQLRVLSRIVRAEAWMRGAWVRRRDEDAAVVFTEVGRIAEDFAHGHPKRAGQRLQRLVRGQEVCRAALPFRRHPQS